MPIFGFLGRRKSLPAGQIGVPELKSTTFGSEELLHQAIRQMMNAPLDYEPGKAPATAYARIKLIQSNPVAQMCVRRLSWATGSVDWLVDGKDTGDLYDLLNKPSDDTRFGLWTLVAASLAATGNAYLTKTDRAMSRKEKGPAALHFMRPDRMTPHVDPSTGKLTHYEYHHANKGMREYSPEEVCHMRHPWLLDDYCGEPITESLWETIKLYSGYTILRRKILENSGGVPAMIVFEGKKPMGDRQREETQERFDEFKIDGENFGSILLMDAGGIEGSVKKIELAGDIQRLQPTETMNNLEAHIATMFGVPRLLLGVGGDATYANQGEARRYFWLDTVVPGYVKPIEASLSAFLGVEIKADLDSVPAIADHRLTVVNGLKAADWLTINEKREMMGFKKIEGGDEVLQPASMIPLEKPGDMGDGSGFQPGDDEPLEPDLAGGGAPNGQGGPALNGNGGAPITFDNDITGA